MMDELYTDHLLRLRTRTVDKMHRKDVMRWLCENTTVAGMPFSTVDHEYQMQIGSDESREVVVRKCSQVGLSELSIRLALGLAAVMDYYNIIYTFPTAMFAAKYVKTRIDPVITGSPYLKAATSGSSAVDSSEVKKVGDSFVYFNGASSGNAAISVAADHLIHDELDFSDEVIISQYTSRLTHSQHKNKTLLSTPTVPEGPIDNAFTHSRRFWNMCKCEHCGHSFVPDYYQHVKIPGFNKSLEELTKANLHTTRYKEAVLLCPNCYKAPSLLPEHREWVQENPEDTYDAVGYQVQPFDAPKLILLPDLIRTSTQYKRPADFKNFSLGLPAEDNMSGIQADELERCSYQGEASGYPYHVLGADMGLTCHITIGGVNADGSVNVVHMERVPIGEFRRRYTELSRLYRVTIKVVDTQPYVETILNLQDTDIALYGAVFTSRKGIELYDVKDRAEDPDSATMSLRQVDIHKSRTLDKLLDEIREGNVVFRKTPEWDTFKTQMRSAKRTQAELRDGEFQSQWIKTDGNDHYHMALMYLWVAAQMRWLSVRTPGASVRGVRRFRNKSISDV